MCCVSSSQNKQQNQANKETHPVMCQRLESVLALLAYVIFCGKNKKEKSSQDVTNVVCEREKDCVGLLTDQNINNPHKVIYMVHRSFSFHPSTILKEREGIWIIKRVKISVHDRDRYHA